MPFTFFLVRAKMFRRILFFALHLPTIHADAVANSICSEQTKSQFIFKDESIDVMIVATLQQPSVA